MSKKCASCGLVVADVEPYCPDCGGTDFCEKGGAGKAIKPIIILLIVAVVGVAGFLVLRNFFGYRGALNSYFDAIEDGNGKEYAKCMFFDEFVELLSEEANLSVDEFYATFDEYVEKCDYNLEAKFGSDYKISYKVTDSEKLDDDEKEYVEAAYSLMFDDVNLGSGYEFDLEITVKGSEDEKTYEANGAAIKINDDWVISSLVVEDYPELGLVQMLL